MKHVLPLAIVLTALVSCSMGTASDPSYNDPFVPRAPVVPPQEPTSPTPPDLNPLDSCISAICTILQQEIAAHPDAPADPYDPITRFIELWQLSYSQYGTAYADEYSNLFIRHTDGTIVPVTLSL